MYQDNYLAHFGIKGMKWGVRRYQKKDGTYTPEGKKRKTSIEKRQTVKKAINSGITALGIGTTITGASTGNPLLGFAGMGMIQAGIILASTASRKINSPFINSAASSGSRVIQSQKVHDFMQQTSIQNDIFNQHNQTAINMHNQMVNNFQSFNTHMGF